jgi:hypothetical protein
MKLYLDGTMAWFALIFFSESVLFAPAALHRHWRGATKGEESVIGGMVFKSDELQRGHVRATVPTLVSGTALGLTVLVLFLIPPVPEGGIDYPGSIALSSMLAVWAITAPLYWSIVLLNRPKFLVAPRFREHPGAVLARRSRKAAPSGTVQADPHSGGSSLKARGR